MDVRRVWNDKLCLVDEIQRQDIHCLRLKPRNNEQKQLMKLASNVTLTEMVTLDQDYLEWIQLEGQCKTSQVTPLRRYPWYGLVMITLLYAVLTAVVGLLALKYSVRFRAWLFYSICEFESCSHVLILGNDDTYEIQGVSIGADGKKVFFYRRLKYFRPEFYCPIGYSISKEGHLFNKAFEKIGLTHEEVDERRVNFGRCEHKVKVPGIGEYLFNELLKGFFIMQYVVCATFILERNYQFTGIMLGFSLITTIINYVLLRLSYKKIQEIADKTHLMEVLREGQKLLVDSSELVPGDLFYPKDVIPCDCILISGEVYVNEASLTGENIPIGKFPSPDLDRVKSDTCWLFEGAKLLESRGNPVVLVVNTGFATRKGRIFRKILNNNPSMPEFLNSGLKYLGIMFVLGYMIFFGMLPVMLRNQIAPFTIVLRAFDLFGWTLPAALPIFFNLCYSLSLTRLRSANIFGTEPQKTVVSGKIKTMCFDKTGTLTMNNMDLYCIHSISGENTCQEIVASEVSFKDPTDLLYKFFASCHTVRNIGGELMGDELDLRMFLFSEFELEPIEDVGIKFVAKREGSRLEVLRINQFESKFQCMSVLVRDTSTNKTYCFVKGAPEKIQRSSLNKYNDFNKLVASLSLAGLRNIAFAYKEVPNPDFFMITDRPEFEKDLTLLGVVGFENKLKHDTVETIRILMQGGIEPKIITGDNIYIAVETAIRTEILPHGSKIILLEGAKQDDPLKHGGYNGLVLTHSKVTSEGEPIFLTFEQYVSQPLPMAIDNDFLKMDPEPELPQTIKLFARISPESKALIVRRFREFYKAIDPKHKVGMCGDGANDLMAIKEADVGMGISETDSSFAANFAISELRGVQHVIREGKATLMNLIEIFRFYGASNFLKITSSMILLWDNSYFTGNQITFFNYTSTLWLTLFLAFSHPSDKLTTQVPEDNFMSLQNFLVYNGNWGIPTVGLVLCVFYATQQSFFVFTPSLTGDWTFKSHSNTVVFICIELMFVCCIFWTYVGSPFKKPMYYNYLLSILLCLDIAISIALYFIPPLPFFGVVAIDKYHGGVLLGITLATLAVHLVYTIVIRMVAGYKKEEPVSAE